MHWFYGIRDRGSRHEYRWRRCPRCGTEDYKTAHTTVWRYTSNGKCWHCGWSPADAR